MSDLREDVRYALQSALEAAPAPVRADPSLILEELVSAALRAVQGSLLADLGQAGAAISSAEFKIIKDCQPPDMGMGAMI